MINSACLFFPSYLIDIKIISVLLLFPSINSLLKRPFSKNKLFTLVLPLYVCTHTLQTGEGGWGEKETDSLADLYLISGERKRGSKGDKRKGGK